MEDLQEEVEIEEDIEKHDTLNPKLFDGTVLKPTVVKKILEIVEAFEQDLEEDGITIIIKDIVLLGSNANYNYTKDSDLDIHIVADTARLANDLFPVLYSLYRNKFNQKYDIEFFGIPVELYVEANELNVNSNGIYSVLNNKWLKEPVQQDIPDLDKEAFDIEFNKLVDEFKEFAAEYEAGTVTDADAEAFISKIYTYRQEGLKNEGEWSTGNLLFKEFRNCGYLDNLKDMKDCLKADRLSLEEDLKNFEKIRTILAQTIHESPIVHANGIFEFYLISESDVHSKVQALERLSIVDSVECFASGKYDFSHIGYYGKPVQY